MRSFNFIGRRIQARRRKLWVKALRSGEYEQTRSWLRDDDGFCCLGVACDVYRQVTGNGEWVAKLCGTDDRHPLTFDLGEDGADASVLPWEVQEWFGLTESRGQLVSGGQSFGDEGNHSIAHTLTDANDDGGLSFDEIADLIDNGEVEVK